MGFLKRLRKALLRIAGVKKRRRYEEEMERRARIRIKMIGRSSSDGRWTEEVQPFSDGYSSTDGGLSSRNEPHSSSNRP